MQSFKRAMTKETPFARRFTLDEYLAADCFQFQVPALAIALHQYTNGCMCNGCPVYDGGRCKALNKMIRATGSSAPLKQSEHIETVRDEATRRGISISEVRRQRNARS